MTKPELTAVALTVCTLTALLAPAALADRAASDVPEPATAELRVCADPSNLPYSNDKQEGFENKIARLIADDFHVELRYFWFAEHKTFLRRTLLDGLCDVVLSVPSGLQPLATTKPYFASTYVAVTRANDARRFMSFDDPWLKDALIGLQLVGKEGATTPPVFALSKRGLNQHITPFPMWSDGSDPTPQGKIVDAVAAGTIDVAFVWGPFAGYFAKAHRTELRLDPLSDSTQPDLSFVFAMAAGVRKTDTALRDRLQGALDRHAAEIADNLKDFAIPTVPVPVPTATAAADRTESVQPPHH